ncbi:hypothetical protein EDD22DRAFT_1005067 [Suillus occidentalis]|nr:hypothetical protein EDD22DRAFT_1005067 [Suillus occidentalis]
MAKASTRVRNDKEPRKRGHPPKKKFQPPSRTQVEVQVPPTQEAISKTKPWPRPIPQKKLGTSESSAATVPGGSSSTPDVGATVAASKLLALRAETHPLYNLRLYPISLERSALLAQRGFEEKHNLESTQTTYEEERERVEEEWRKGRGSIRERPLEGIEERGRRNARCSVSVPYRPKTAKQSQHFTTPRTSRRNAFKWFAWKQRAHYNRPFHLPPLMSLSVDELPSPSPFPFPLSQPSPFDGNSEG